MLGLRQAFLLQLILEEVSLCVEPVTLTFRRKSCFIVYDEGDGQIVLDGLYSHEF